MPTTDSPVQRKSSIKSKLRNISLNRHKAHFDPEPSAGATNPDSPEHSTGATMTASESVESFDSYSRGRTQDRHAPTTINRPSSNLRPEHPVAGTAPVPFPQSQVASPVLSRPLVLTSENPTTETPEKMVEKVEGPNTGSLASAKLKEDATLQAATPAAPGGFLSSMINAATNLGTALSTNSPKATPSRTTSTTEESLLEPRSKLSNIQFDASSRRSMEPEADPGELSLRDMGLTHAITQDNTNPETESSHTTPRLGNTQQNTLGADRDTRPRSGSVMTTQSRKRRGSASMSVFGGTDGQAQKITGFAVASNKRNREFHSTFRSVPDADYLLDDYGCALQKEILVHGRMYVSESHICFNSNIFGWVTNLVLAFTDITSLEKKSTAGIFPNAIQIYTLQAKHVFASFISRDTTFDLIVNIWRLTHPLIQMTAHGIEVASGHRDELYDSDSNESAVSDDSESAEDAASDSDDGKTLVPVLEHSNSSRDSPDIALSTVEAKTGESSKDSPGFPGPREHPATEAPSLSDGTAFAKALIDETFDAPLGRVFELLYGSDISFMQEFLETNQKVLDVKVGQFADKAGKDVRPSSYVKPLSGPIGPKQTRCLLEDILEIKDFEKCVQVVQLTTSPDVPSGDAFTIKTRFALMWGPRNTTRLVANCMIEWSKNSWIKGPIEKACTNGQVQYMADIAQAMKANLAADPSGKRKKSKPKKLKIDAAPTGDPVTTSAVPQQQTDKGLFETILGVAQNINLNILTLVLLLGMMVAMIRMQRSVRQVKSERRLDKSQASLAQSNWPTEESDLWRWLSEKTVQASVGNNLNIGTNLNSMTALQIQEARAQIDTQLAVLENAQVMLKEKDH